MPRENDSNIYIYTIHMYIYLFIYIPIQWKYRSIELRKNLYFTKFNKCFYI